MKTPKELKPLVEAAENLVNVIASAQNENEVKKAAAILDWELAKVTK